MTIKKLRHSCMAIKEGALTILTDPGMYSADETKSLTGIDVVLVSDEHQDHFDIPSVKMLLKNNPGLRIITQQAVNKLLADEGIKSELLLDKQSMEINGVKIEGCGVKHAVLHSSIPQSDNTGYIIADRFFYPGDALTIPHKKIEVLALPAAAPWLKLSEAIDYALAIKPKICFPVHDGMSPSPFMAKMIGMVLEKNGIKLILPDGEMEV
ncbi:MAG: MBL fold metallo-hydrolase [Candidatus Doudnabacteria bacterium]|nr:MBL fold metallo-hydrolase [Candidatus Doudnabacteria bacterium]